MRSLIEVEAVAVPRTAVEALMRHLRDVGRQGHEGMGLWVGTQDGTRFAVRGTVIPAQRHIRNADGVRVLVGAEELHRINVGLFKKKLTLLGQIHTHPGRAYHSSTDDANAVATAVGSLSLVVPDFASAPFDIRKVATYRLDARGRWSGMTAAAAERLITIQD